MLTVSRFLLRSMTEGDIPQVTEIERESFPTTWPPTAYKRALDNGQESVTLEVRRSNVGAQALYEKYRFLKIGVRRRYYSDNHEDAVIMATPPIQDGSYREHLAYLREA